MSFQLQRGEDFYRIVGAKGEEGEAVVYGRPATLLASDGHLYVSFCDDEEPDDMLEGKIFQCMPVAVDLVEGVEFVDENGDPLTLDDDDDDDDDGAGDDDDDDDEAVIVGDDDDDDDDSSGLPAA